MSSKDKGEYDYVVTLTQDNFIASDSLAGQLPDEFYETQNEEFISDSFETQLILTSGEKQHVGKLLSFEMQNDQTILYCEMRKSSALQLISGKRFDSVSVNHGDDSLWSADDIPKLKDTVSVDLNGPEAYVTLTVRKISVHGRHK